MVSTRSTSQSPVKKTAATSSGTATKKVTTAATEGRHFTCDEPLRLFVGPRALSQRSRFLTLCDPVTQRPRRYLFCPSLGVFELTNIDAHKLDPRSILFAPVDLDEAQQVNKTSISNGYINKHAVYMTATRYDLAFALLPIAANSSKNELFQSLDDLIDSRNDTYDLKYIVRQNYAAAEKAMERICDTVEAGDEKMFRFSRDKTLRMMIHRAERVSKIGLPSSMEEKFVSRVLEAPVLSVKREESTISIVRSESQPSQETEETSDSQSSVNSTAPSVVFSEASGASTNVTVTSSGPEAVELPSIPDQITALQRLSVAFDFICASYIQPSISKDLKSALHTSASPIDMKPLKTYLAKLSALKAEAFAANDMSSFSRKRGGLEDEEAAEARADKKRRLEEEERKKKANTSRGVKELAKVNVTGMKKMSSFFTKVPSKSKS